MQTSDEHIDDLARCLTRHFRRILQRPTRPSDVDLLDELDELSALGIDILALDQLKATHLRALLWVFLVADENWTRDDIRNSKVAVFTYDHNGHHWNIELRPDWGDVSIQNGGYTAVLSALVASGRL